MNFRCDICLKHVLNTFKTSLFRTASIFILNKNLLDKNNVFFFCFLKKNPFFYSPDCTVDTIAGIRFYNAEILPEQESAYMVMNLEHHMS